MRHAYFGPLLVFLWACTSDASTDPANPGETVADADTLDRLDGITTPRTSLDAVMDGHENTAAIDAAVTDPVPTPAPIDSDGGGSDGIDEALSDPTTFSESAGTRLKIRSLRNASGQSSFGAFFDAELNSECAFKAAADGDQRCLPIESSFFVGSEFADASCAVPAVVLPSGGCLPRFVRRGDRNNPCEFREHIHPLGRPLGEYFARADTGECVRASPARGEMAYAVGPEVAARTFVRATVRPMPSRQPDTLTLLVGEAEDGARYQAGWAETTSGKRCSMVPAADGTIRCLASPALAISGPFSDATCTQATAAYAGACQDMPAYAIQRNGQTCPPTANVRQLGARLETSFTRSQGLCLALPQATGVERYALGSEVPPSGFPQLRESHDGPERLQRRFLVSPGGQRIGGNWYDSQRSEACTPTPFPDGHFRCVPSGPALDFDFGDSFCTRPLLRDDGSGCPPKYATTVDGSTCPPLPLLYSVGTRHIGTVFVRYILADGFNTTIECLPDQAPDPNAIYYQTAPVANSALAELTGQ